MSDSEKKQVKMAPVSKGPMVFVGIIALLLGLGVFGGDLLAMVGM